MPVSMHFFVALSIAILSFVPYACLAANKMNAIDQCWCPISCVGVGKDAKWLSWADLDPAVRFVVRGIMLGSRVMVTGSDNQGAPQGFYLVELKGGQNGKLEKINVPEEFPGFVQSGCCVEI